MCFAGDNHYDKKKGISFSQEMLETQRALNAHCGDDMQKRTPQQSMNCFYYTLKMRTLRSKLVDYLVKHVIKPFGIPKGSERQGKISLLTPPVSVRSMRKRQ